MTDASKAVVWKATYELFGTVSAVTGAASIDLRFPGQWFQIEDGLAYNWHRHYDPTLGRYTQADPLRFVDGPSIYGYAGQSPAMNIDPRGFVEIKGFGGHSVRRMMEKGITPRAVMDACENPIKIVPQANGDTRHCGASCNVILSPTGWVVTVF